MRQRTWSGLHGVIIAVLLTFMSGAAHAESDKRDVQAREAFASGRYQEALDIFAKLYAEKVHPNYLRNIGRCYQNLGEPDKAIGSFREYLRQAKNVRPDERKEVEGYIQEMEELKRQKAAANAAPVPTPTPTPTRTVNPNATAAVIAPAPSSSGAAATALPTAPPPQTVQHGNPVLVEVPNSSSHGDGEARPIYGRWWFWAIVGGVVLGGVAVAAATGAFTKTEEPACPAGATCPQ